jgi:16S rRNA (guanine527-N7)-methyltransferase
MSISGVQAEEHQAVVHLGRLAAAHGITFAEHTAETLITFARLLLAWSERINLTAARSLSRLLSEHFPDAFAIAARLDDRVRRIIDVGSGGGLPAIPLALLRPASRFVLCEPTAKKVAFLRTATRELQLTARMQIQARRIEGANEDDASSFDVAISRATFPPAEWLALGWQLVRPGGRVFALTSVPLEADLRPPELKLVHSARYDDLGGGREEPDRSRKQRWLAELRRST